MKNYNNLNVDDVANIISETINRVNKGEISNHELKVFIEKKLGSSFLENTVQGHGYSKPHGYAGDYEIIDFIYTEKKSVNTIYKPWDEYFHQQAAPKAVRNRKKYFKEQVAQILPKGGVLLNIASGPARDLFELLKENPNLNITTTCVDLDPNAIEYAKKLNQLYLDKINFINKNIFRYSTDVKYDVIWSAGLFDYFNDKAFVLLLKRFKNWIKPKGQIIIGNFNENHNPSRQYMEIFGEWYLIHRTEEQLYSLAKEAGFDDNQIEVRKEPENVNLFLHIKN